MALEHVPTHPRHPPAESEEDEPIPPPAAELPRAPEGRRVVYYHKDEPAMVRGEYIEQKQREDANNRRRLEEEKIPIPAASETLRIARQKLLMLMDQDQYTSKKLKLTPKAVMKMKLEDVQNHVLSFDAETQLVAGASFAKTMFNFFAQAVEGAAAMSKYSNPATNEYPLRNYAARFEAHPNLDRISQRIAIQHFDRLSKVICPEMELGLMYLQVGAETYNANTGQNLIQKIISPNQKYAPPNQDGGANHGQHD